MRNRNVDGALENSTYTPPISPRSITYGIMTEELVICEIRIDEAAGRGDSDSRMTSFEVIMPLKLQSTKMIIYGI